MKFLKFLKLSLIIFPLIIIPTTALNISQLSFLPSTYSSALIEDNSYIWSYSKIDNNLTKSVEDPEYIISELHYTINLTVLQNPNTLKYAPFGDYPDYFNTTVNDGNDSTNHDDLRFREILPYMYLIDFQVGNFPILVATTMFDDSNYFDYLAFENNLEYSFYSSNATKIDIVLEADTVTFRTNSTMNYETWFNHGPAIIQSSFEYIYERETGIMIRGKRNSYTYVPIEPTPVHSSERRIDLETNEIDRENTLKEISPRAAVNVPFVISPIMIMIAITIYHSRKNELKLRI